MQEARAAALVLRTVDYGESDRVVTFLTREAGKLSAFARGARASKRRFAGALEPFQLLAIRYRDRKGDLISLAAADILQPRQSLLTDSDLIARAYYLTELATEATREREPCPELFSLVDGGYEVMASPAFAGLASAGRDGFLAALEMKLLDAAGYRPRLHACGECDALPGDDSAFRFVPASGGVLCEGCAGREGFPVSAGTLGLLDGSLELPLDGLLAVAFDAAQLSEARALTSLFLRWQLGKELKSARFLAG